MSWPSAELANSALRKFAFTVVCRTLPRACSIGTHLALLVPGSKRFTVGHALEPGVMCWSDGRQSVARREAAQVEEAAFVRVREALARRYRNSNMRPEGAATYARLFALRAAMFHVDEVLPHVEAVTAGDVQVPLVPRPWNRRMQVPLIPWNRRLPLQAPADDASGAARCGR